MSKLVLIDMRRVHKAISLMPNETRIGMARQLRECLAQIGAGTMGASDEEVGCDSAGLTRRISSTIAALRRLESPQWVPNPENPAEGATIELPPLGFDASLPSVANASGGSVDEQPPAGSRKRRA